MADIDRDYLHLLMSQFSTDHLPGQLVLLTLFRRHLFGSCSAADRTGSTSEFLISRLGAGVALTVRLVRARFTEIALVGAQWGDVILISRDHRPPAGEHAGLIQ